MGARWHIGLKGLAWLCLVGGMGSLPAQFASGAPAPAAACMQVRIITNDFVLPAKTARLDGWGGSAGVCFTHRSVEGPGTAEEWLGEADLVILDTPRPSDAAQVKERLGPGLEESGISWIGVGGGPPASAHLPADVARRLVGYYGAGGEANFRRLAEYLGKRHRGETMDAEQVPAPQPMPKRGYYHPAAPTLFIEATALRNWLEAAGTEGQPRVAVLIAPNAISSMETGVLDALIARSAAHGVQAFGVWFEAAPAQALVPALQGLDVAAVVNLTHLQNGAVRSAEFAQLDVPVLQTLNYRQGSAEAWRAASSGVPPALLATFVAVPEGWGMSDPMVLGAVENGQQQPIVEQIEAMAAKLARLAALRHKPAEEKKLALMFWNYPAGEKNLSASHLNVPRSLALLSGQLREAGYKVRASTEEQLIAAGQAMLGGYYRPETLTSLLDRDLAETFSVAGYRRWLTTLPAAQRDALLARWGAPEDHPAVRMISGEPVFVIPRLRLDHLLVMPLPPRADHLGQATHDQASLPSHYYLAAYLFLREGYRADALIHFGTHGTQEWTPGKDRGLWVNDYPHLTLGDLPVFYPYIQDNVGEAVQAKRRGRAVIISHQTPPFAPAGLYDELRDLHALVHEYLQLDAGAARDHTAATIAEAALSSGIAGDMGWDALAIGEDFPAFFLTLHDQLHELARSTMPLGLHTFGAPATPEHRLSTVMQQLGEPYYRALGQDPQELFAEDFSKLHTSAPYHLLQRHLRDGADPEEVTDPELRRQLARARELDHALADTQEMEALLRGLAGGFVPPGAGGDPVRNPDIRSGRNLFPFEPDKIPTQAAYAAGAEALSQLIAAYRHEHDGQTPQKLAFSLWSSEAIRHLGVLESQVLHALGLRPVWDEGGRVTELAIMPHAELAQPRIDVVVQVTSVYRDQFDSFMRLLASAIDRLADLEDGNALALNRDTLAARLQDRGVDAVRARQLAALRIFSNAPGEYGSGLTAAVLGDQADKADASLAEAFLSRLQYAYGQREGGIGPEAGNLFAEQLHGVQAAVLARSSNVHGMLSTDHPFEYLGGLSLAIRHLDSASPALYVTDLRESSPKTTAAATFMANELRSRYLNPQWIGAMKEEGYAGTLEVLNAVNNLFGWQVADPAMVRDEQWQAIHDTYVRDVRQLGVDEWFERSNPTAQAQLITRMREAIERGYWQADATTRTELAQRLTRLMAMDADAPAVAVAPDFGLSTRLPTRAAVPPKAMQPRPDAQPPAATNPPVRGQLMREVVPPEAQPTASVWRLALACLLLLLCVGTGGWRQWRANLHEI